MLVVEIDMIDAEAAEARIAGLANVVRLAADAARVGIFRIANDAEFSGENDLVALALDGAPDKFFVGVRSVNVGGVEKGDAEFESAVDGSDRFVVVASGVKLGHAHTAESLGGHFEACVTESARLHDGSLRYIRCSGCGGGLAKMTILLKPTRTRLTKYPACHSKSRLLDGETDGRDCATISLFPIRVDRS